MGQVSKDTLKEAETFARECREKYGRSGSDGFASENKKAVLNFRELFLELQDAQRKRQVSNSHLLGTKYQLMSFVVAHSDQRVDELTHIDIEKWLDQEEYNTARTKLNVIRYLAMHSDAAKTAFELGHSQGVKLLYRNYAGMVTKQEAEYYWGIEPEKAGKVIRFVA